MATLDLRVEDDLDDAHERQDDTNFSNSSTVVQHSAGFNSNQRFSGGHRVTGLTIKGTTINVCHLVVQAAATSVDDVLVIISAEDVDAAVNFDTTQDVNDRARTTASVAWAADSIGTGEVNSPSIVDIGQELADRGSFGDDGAVFFMNGDSSAQKTFNTFSHETDPDDAVLVHVEFTAGGVTFVPRVMVY